MSRSTKLEEIISRIQLLHEQLEDEFDKLFAEKQRQFHYHLDKGKVVFEQGVRELQKHYRTGIIKYLVHAKLKHILMAPLIYSVFFPIVLLDIFVSVYQHICFRVFGIPRVRRGDYIIIDRQHLSYLNIIEKINCVYCGYGNGFVEYTREIFARTEQYWCPIKHAQRGHSFHDRAHKFADYGYAEEYKEKLKQLREELKNSI